MTSGDAVTVGPFGRRRRRDDGPAVSLGVQRPRFGPIVTVDSPPDHVEALQYPLVRSHALGLGRPYSTRGWRAASAASRERVLAYREQVAVFRRDTVTSLGRMAETLRDAPSEFR